MKLNAFGSDKHSIYYIMTTVFPGVRFGEFYKKRDEKTLLFEKNKFWIKIEEKFFECANPAEFIDFLFKYKASNSENETTFGNLFPKDSWESFSFIDLQAKLQNKNELAQFISDCSIKDGNVFKGGLFLYCARILDAKFLVYFFSKKSEGFIYWLLKRFDALITADKVNFPATSIFNESKKWNEDWQAEYDSKHYRFIWQESKDAHWGTLNGYKPSNPYEYFIHECQKKYTIVNIGLNGEKDKIQCLEDFKKYAEKGLEKINKNYKFSKINEQDFVNADFSDIEGNVLIGIEEKDGAETMTPDFFKPKSWKETTTAINFAKKYKKAEHDDKEKYKFTENEVREINDIYSKAYDKSAKDKKLKEEFERLLLETENPDALGIYEKLEILQKPEIQEFLSEEDKKTVNKFAIIAARETVSTETKIGEDEEKKTDGDEIKASEAKSKDSFSKIKEEFQLLIDDFFETAERENDLNKSILIDLNKNLEAEFFDKDKYDTLSEIKSVKDDKILKKRKKFYKDLLKEIKKVKEDSPLDELRQNLFVKKYLDLDPTKPKSMGYKQKVCEAFKTVLLDLKARQLFSSLCDIIFAETSKIIDREKSDAFVTKIREDFYRSDDRNDFYSKMLESIQNFDAVCSDKVLKENFYVKEYINLDTKVPIDTVKFRDILSSLKAKVCEKSKEE